MAKRVEHSSLMGDLTVDQNNNYVPRMFGSGYFHKLPQEIIFMTLDQLDIPSLGDLAMSSKMMHSFVNEYLQTEHGLKKLFNLWKHEVRSFDSGRFPEGNAAKFLRKLVLFLPSKAKISFISEVLLKSGCMWRKGHFQPNLYFGCFIQEVLKGWTESEIQLAHDIVDRKSRRLNDLNTVLVAKEGSMPAKEIEVRLYYRSVYWTAVPYTCNRGKWLNLILKAQPHCFQAKILLLMFAPINADGTIMWDIFTSDQAPNFGITLMEAISEIAEVLRILHSSEISWDTVTTLIDEISVYPVQWAQQNICQLILGCGLEALKYILSGYLIGLQYEEFMHLIAVLPLLPIHETQVVAFAEIMHHAVDWPELSPAAHALFMTYFHAFVDRCRSIFDNDRDIQIPMIVRQFFPRRRSRRLASKVCSNKRSHKCMH